MMSYASTIFQSLRFAAKVCGLLIAQVTLGVLVGLSMLKMRVTDWWRHTVTCSGTNDMTDRHTSE